MKTSVFFILLWFIPVSVLAKPSASSQSEGILLSKNWSKVARKRRAIVLSQSRLNQALELIQKKDYLEGVKKLYLISQKNTFPSRRTEIRFIIGKTLMQLGLYYAASFQLISVIQTGDKRYIYKSLRNLSKIASIVGDTQLFQFALDKGGERNMMKEYKDAFYYQYGKHQLQKRNYRKSRTYLTKIRTGSPFYKKARYHLALSYAEKNMNRKAIRAFDDILSVDRNLSSRIRIAALIGKARVYYQAKKWNLSTQFYRQVPKDSIFWHDTLMENNWALLRAGKFRSAMSGFQTIHSSYYQNYYQPDSFLLRSIVYMYICKFDEMKKILTLFNRLYSPIYQWVKKQTTSFSSYNYYQNVIFSAQSESSSATFPKPIATRIYKSSDFQSLHRYLIYLKQEKGRIIVLPSSWRNSGVGRYALALVNKQINLTTKQLNLIAVKHLKVIQKELANLFQQEKYLKYENLRGRRTLLKKKISSQSMGNLNIVESISRDYFVQNGFEFWSFNNEYWLDELGNYHYVGLQNCQ